MDWSKAKNILIIAFIITNIFLAYVLINNRNVDTPIVGEDFIEDVKSFLLEKDITVAVEIPKNMPSLPLLSMEYEVYNPQDIARRFLGEYTTETIKGNIYYLNKDKMVTIKNGNEIVYENASTDKIVNSISTKKALEIAEEFLIEKNFSTDDYKLSFSNYQDNSYFIEYTKIADHVYFEKSYMKFKISMVGVEKFERYWIELADPDNTVTMTIMSAPRALLKLLTMEEAYGKTIEEISVCYYFDSQNYIGVNDPKKTKGGKATPAWRVVFNDGSKIFLEDN